MHVITSWLVLRKAQDIREHRAKRGGPDLKGQGRLLEEL